MKKTIKVVAAIIENDDQEILCALRSLNMSQSNLWEFPGGKVEKDEDICNALTREIKEELNCSILTSELYHEHMYEYEEFFIHLISIKSIIIEGSPHPNEHSKLLWLKRENLPSLKWAPADIPIVELLCKELI